MAKRFSILFTIAFKAQFSNGHTLGTGLWRTYTSFIPLPTTSLQAIAQGWAHEDAIECSPRLGIPYAQNVDGRPSSDKPVVLYFTPQGQIAGLGILAYGKFYGPVVDLGYWVSTGNDEEWFISTTFRDPDQVCSANFTSSDLIGDRVLVNADSLSFVIPMNQTSAVAENFETGSCFESMGTHSFLDVVGKNGTMTWKSSNLMPVVPMYDRNQQFNLNAIFFTTPFQRQVSIPFLKGNEWEPVTLVNTLMCKNFCDENCGWDDTHLWATAHFYFSDPSQVTCLGGCKTGCCE